MIKKYNFCSWQIEIICLLVGCFLTLPSSRVGAQVIPDGTLGAVSSRINPINGLSDRIDGGAIRGSNLFHSFQRFDIGTGRSVFFSNPVGITNIFSRVTGVMPSNIDGILGINGPSNLFLINPNGILFGAGASLDLKGSFVATTASSVLFPNGEQFSATRPQPVPLLTIDSAAPIGLQFESNPGSIQLKNAHLSTQPATTMGLVGGDINIDNSSLTARLGSRLELGSIKDSGVIGLGISSNEVRLKFPDSVKRGNISINNSSSIRSIIRKFNDALDPSEYPGASLSGQIQLTGHSVLLSNYSELIAENGLFVGPYDLKSTDIKINASGIIDLKQSSSIINSSGGNIIIRAAKLSLSDESQIVNKIDAKLKYDSVNETIGVGNIALNVDEEINLNNSLTALTIKTSKDDSVLIKPIPYDQKPLIIGPSGFDDNNYIDTYRQNANYEEINETSGLFNTYNVDGSLRVAARSGNINILAKSISLSDGSQILINSSTALNQNGSVGNIKINVRESVIIDNDSSVSSRAFNSNDVAVGNINIIGNSLVLKDGGRISTTVEGQAGTKNVGNIELDFQKLILLKNRATITASVGKNVALPFSISTAVPISGQTISAEDLAKGSTIGGGNIRIKVFDGFIAAALNSDIQANSYSGSGGEITISAKGVIGLVQRTREELANALNTTSPNDLDGSRLLTNDVIAISQSNAFLNGQTNINSLNLDPSNGLNQVPKEPRATDIADSCQVSQGKESVQFYDIGRGGLPPRPEDPLSMDLIEWSTQPSPLSAARAQDFDPSSRLPIARTTRLLPPCQSR